MTSGLFTPAHLAIVLVIMLLLFGAKRLPETGRSLGGAMREFRRAITGGADVSEPAQPPGITARGQSQPRQTRTDTERNPGHP
jgi:sec-independent protein translocase protein TatA